MATPETSRRRFITLGIGATAALAAGGGVLRWFAGGYAARLDADDLPLALSTKEFAIVRALVEALLPAADGFPSGLVAGVHQRIDEEMWSADEWTRRDMKNGLQFFEHATVLHGFAGRFTSLPPTARLAYLDTTLRARPGALQQVAFALKELAYLFYYVSPGSWQRIGYEGPWVRDARPPESALAYRELLRARRPS